MASLNKTNNIFPANTSKNWFYVAFVVINLFLSCYYLDVWITPNTASRAVSVLSLYEDNTPIIDKYTHYTTDVSVINNHHYSNKAPLPTFLVYPFYMLYKGIGAPALKDSTLKKYPIYIYEDINPDFDGRSELLPKSSIVFILGDIVCGALPFVLILLLSLFSVKEISTKMNPVILVMLTFYSAFLFSYAGTFTSHILAGLFALLGYIYLKKKSYILSGIMVGLAMATEYPFGILIPVWALLIYLNEKKLSKSFLFCAGIIPGLVFVLYYNYHLTGSVFKTPYSYEAHQHKQAAQDVGFYFPSFSAFWGLVFSAYRGVLYYTPILLLMLWYGIKYGYENIYKKVNNKMDLIKTGAKNYLLITIVVYLLLYSAYYEWAGGWSYGPRYLIPLVIIVLYEGIIFLSKKAFSTYVFYVIAAMGLLFIWLDKSTKIFEIPNNPGHSGNPIFNVIIPDFFNHKFNANTLPVFLFNSNPVLTIYAWPLLFCLSIIALAIWYSKLYQAKENNFKLSVSIAPLVVFYIVIIVAQCTGRNNNLSLNNTGIFGAWKHFDLASTYMDQAGSETDAPSKKKWYALAAGEFKKVTQYTPTYHYYYYLGQSYTGAGFLDSAIDAYKKVLELNPKYSLAAKNVGLLYSNKTQYDSAIHYFMIAYKADSNIGALINIGAAYQYAGNKALAYHYDSLVLIRDPNNKMVLSNLAIMHNSIDIHKK